MQRHMMKSKIHRATITSADLHYEGSLTVDEDLLDAADLLGGEPQDNVRQALIGLQEMVKGELCSEDITVVLLLPDDETPLAQRAAGDRGQHDERQCPALA